MAFLAVIPRVFVCGVKKSKLNERSRLVTFERR
jgi:hypothetical protein